MEREALQAEAEAEVLRRKALRQMQQARTEAQQLVRLQGMPMVTALERSIDADAGDGQLAQLPQPHQPAADVSVDDEHALDDW